MLFKQWDSFSCWLFIFCFCCLSTIFFSSFIMLYQLALGEWSLVWRRQGNGKNCFSAEVRKQIISIYLPKATLRAARPSRIVGQNYSQAGTFCTAPSSDILQRYDNSPVIETAWESVHFSSHFLSLMARQWRGSQLTFRTQFKKAIICHYNFRYRSGVPIDLLDV